MQCNRGETDQEMLMTKNQLEDVKKDLRQAIQIE